MKKTLLLASILLMATALFLYFSNLEESPKKESVLDEEIPTAEVAEEVKHAVEQKIILLRASVVAENTTNVSFKVAGMLEKGELELKKGSTFRKNQLLFQVNNAEAFRNLQAAKESLKEKINSVWPQFVSAHPAGKSAWENYIATLEPISLLGELPTFPKENTFLNQAEITQEHQKIKRMETGMADYFYLSPFDGIVLEMVAKPGQKLQPRQKVAYIAKSGDFLVKAVTTVDVEQVKSSQEINILNERKEMIGKAKLVKSVAAKDGTAEMYFKLEKGKKLVLDTPLWIEIQ